MKKPIDNDDEHKQVLYELGLLDDDDDWPLYCKMRDELEALHPDDDTWVKYMGPMREVPKK